MKNIFLDTDKASSIGNFHAHLKEVFEFPSYYGNNLDALYDCLTSISEYITVIVPFGFNEMLNGYGRRIVGVFEDAARNNGYLHLQIEYEEAISIDSKAPATED